jgi:hypothetical protein
MEFYLFTLQLTKSELIVLYSCMLILSIILIIYGLFNDEKNKKEAERIKRETNYYMNLLRK